MLASVLVAALGIGCRPRAEVRGDQAYARGDTKTAREMWATALTRSPLVDFEYNRIQNKWRAVSNEGSEGPFQVLQSKRATTAPIPFMMEALEFRQHARADGCSREMSGRIDAYVLEMLHTLPLAASTPGEVPQKLTGLLELRARTAATAGTPEMIQAIDGLLEKSAALGLAPATPATSLARLEEAITLRQTMRAGNAALTVDLALASAIERLVAVGFEPVTAGKADGTVDRVLALSRKAQQLGASSLVADYLERVLLDASKQLAALAEQEAAKGRYVPAVLQMQKVAAPFPPGHPLRVQLAGMRERAVVFHRQKAEEAATQPFVALFHRSLVRAFKDGDGGAAAYGQARAALSDRFITQLSLRPEVSGCAAIAARFTEKLKRASGTPVVIHTRLDRCDVQADSKGIDRKFDYTTEESYVEQVQVQVGTRLERVQTGTQQVQCTKPSSLGDGSYWIGLCDKPIYENKQFPVYETRNVTHYRDVNRSVYYVETVKSLHGQVSGLATLSWENGEALSVPIEAQIDVSDSSYAYTIPPRYLSKPSQEQRVSRQIPSSFTPENTLHSAVEASASRLVDQAAAAVRAYRARLARARGHEAESAGDLALAEGLYVQSVMLDGEASAEAEAWFSTHWGIAPALMVKLLSSGGQLLPDPAPIAAEPAVAYAASPVTITQDSYLASTAALEQNITRSTEGKMTLRRGTEGARLYVRLSTFDQRGLPGDGDRYTGFVGFDVRGGFLANYLGKPGWGPTIYDMIGGGFNWGAHLEKNAQYDDGAGNEDNEIRPSWSLFGDYTLMLGLRFHYFSFFAGGHTGFSYIHSGDTHSYGGHVEPAARMTIRLFGPNQVILSAWGFRDIPGLPRSDGLSLSFPFAGRDPGHINLLLERMPLSTEQKDSAGAKVELGPIDVWQFSVGVGFEG